MPWRKTSGSSLCRSCGKINRVDAAVCFYCGARSPGLWGFAPPLQRLLGRLDFARLVTAVCVVAYATALALDLPGAMRPGGMMRLLSPSAPALDMLGATGAYAWSRGRWWTVLTAIYLHAGLLHIVFNLLWINQLAPAVEELFGRARLMLIFTAGGAIGFVLSNSVSIFLSVGASGAVFGLLGAIVCYAQSRRGAFGMAVLRQYGTWALVLFVMGFLLPGVNNVAHAGGFVGGWLAARLLGHSEREAEGGLHHLAAIAAAALTAVGFGLALWHGLR
jgi:rhomboid protease GluP